MRTFDEQILWSADQDEYVGSISQDWLQGRTAFGGVITAGATRIAQLAEPDRPLRSLEARFFEPIGPGSFTATLTPLRSGRSVAHVQVDLSQGGRLCFRATACFATPRVSSIALRADSPPPAPPPADLAPLPYIPGVMPAFVQHFDMRFLQGMPFSGATEPVLDGWCRLRGGGSGLPALIALLDAFPAPSMALLSGPTPASTVHWTAHLLHPDPPSPDGWFRYRAQTLAAADGTSTFAATLWDEAGTPLAWSEQLHAVFDAPRA